MLFFEADFFFQTRNISSNKNGILSNYLIIHDATIFSWNWHVNLISLTPTKVGLQPFFREIVTDKNSSFLQTFHFSPLNSIGQLETQLKHFDYFHPRFSFTRNIWHNFFCWWIEVFEVVVFLWRWRRPWFDASQ